MELEGRVWKSKKQWLIEIPALDILTQGKTKIDALEMGKDAVIELINSYFPKDVDDSFEVTVQAYQRGVIGITTNNNSLVLALSLRRQREISGSTVREASERLGSTSPNAYAQYEKAKKRISLDKYEKLLFAANPTQHRHLRIV